jgi:hypothetical protein
MSVRLLLPCLLVLLGAGVQLGCSAEAEAAQDVAAETAQPTEGGQTGGQFCGGFASITCPEGLLCVDDPNDSCEPTAGGADCGGVCVAPDDGARKKPKCDYKDPTMSYVSRDPNECPAILFQCPTGSTAFFNDCGCGCQSTASSCNYEDPDRRYVSQDPEQCAAIRFICEDGQASFFNDCGCGCETPTTTP